MLNRLEQAKQRWGGKVNLIDRWLDKRQLVVVRYCQLSQADEESQLMTLPDSSALKSFSNDLVDYLSLGHFEVFENLLNQFPEQEKLPDLSTIYPVITETTDHCMEFNDRYQDAIPDNADLEADLSELGVILAQRFDLEEQLLEALYLYNT